MISLSTAPSPDALHDAQVARSPDDGSVEPVKTAPIKPKLADAVLDNAMLKDVASKNGDARRKA